MFAAKTTARVVGVLFIVATSTAIVGGSLLLPLGEPDYLVAVAAAEGRIVSGVLIELLLVMSVVAIAVMMYPLLKRQDEGLALGYIGARTVEGVLLLAAAVSGLLVLSLAQEYAAAGAADVRVVGDSLLAARDWTYLTGSLVMFGVTALILNGLLYRSRLVPTWLSVWGLFGGGLAVARGLLEMYGVEFTALMQGIFTAPIGVQEMVFAVWLIVKGFDTTHLAVSTRDKAERP
jgi:hypothetical protein